MAAVKIFFISGLALSMGRSMDVGKFVGSSDQLVDDFLAGDDSTVLGKGDPVGFFDVFRIDLNA